MNTAGAWKRVRFFTIKGPDEGREGIQSVRVIIVKKSATVWCIGADFFKSLGREFSVTCIRDESPFLNLNLVAIYITDKPYKYRLIYAIMLYYLYGRQIHSRKDMRI